MSTDLAVAVEPKRSRYRIGLNPDCPVHQITAAGIGIVRRSEIVRSVSGDTRRSDFDGTVAFLSDDEIRALKAALRTKVIRTERKGKGSLTRVFSRSSKFFRPMAGDVEAIKFVYLELAEKLPEVEQITRPSLAEDDRTEPATAQAPGPESVSEEARPAKRRG